MTLLDNKLYTPSRANVEVETVIGEVGTNTYTYTMPAEHKGLFSWMHVTYVATATVGNRQLRMAILDSSDTEIMDTHAGAVQTASLTRHYLIMPGIYRETAFVDTEIQVSIPMRLYIPPGYKIKVHDEAAVDASDSMTINFQYEKVL